MDRPSVAVGRPAPEITVQGEQDQPIALRDLWVGAERGIVVAFLRHYG